MTRPPCVVLIFDRKASVRESSVVFRLCGAPANQVIVMGGDYLFSVCSRHNKRLTRAGIKSA